MFNKLIQFSIFMKPNMVIKTLRRLKCEDYEGLLQVMN